MVLLIILITLLFISAIVIFGVGGLAYFSAKGIRRLSETIPLSSSLSRPVKKSLRESRTYGRLIMHTLQQCPPGPLRDRLALAVRPVDEWLSNLTKLERSLERSYGQRNLKREVRQTEFEVSNLRRQLLTVGQNEAASLRELMDSKKQHLSILQELQAFQNRAELKIQKIASDLGATHAEMVLIIARGDFNDNRLNRLDENLKEHVSGIRDMLHAMDEMGYTHKAAAH
jgi:hypothetical protein